jgi:hypothetical protein
MAVINFNRQSILEQNGANLNYAWLTVNGQRYDNGTYYDTSDWVYDDDVEERGINAQPLERILILPYSLQSDQQIEVCLQDDKDYQSCQTVSNSGNRPEAINFVYPASTSSIREKSETAGDSIVDRQNGRYYEGFDWQGVCRNPLIRNYISQPCEVLVTSNGNALTSQGKQSMENLLCPQGPSILSTIELIYGPIPSNLKNELGDACDWA